ncbi:hypothetical protein DL96DRAFT_1631371 [Flagelloscypha sp. PMI_526]|nr:hypothetical protein DL96DRAFT_1631371 [Flagelloscypha sp. PMI_526]
MPSCALLNLPSDVVIQVFYHSTTYSRLSLRQTCTAFYSISRERILWIQCLNRLIQTARLYPPSFPMDEMTNEQLEAAANAPLRFRCNLANGLTASAPTRWLEMGPEKAGQVLRNFVLVPGGRYLVTLTGDVIRFWDIGVVAGEYAPDRFIAEVDCGIGSDRRPWIDAEFNGDELYIRVNGASASGVWSAVYQINPLADSPQFAPLGLLNTKLFKHYSFHFDPYEMAVVYSTAIENGGNMWIWDLATNTLATWPASGRTVKRIYITEGRVLLISLPEPGQLMLQGDVHVVPKFEQQSSPQQAQQLPSPFIHSINWEEDFPDWSVENGSIVTPSSWEVRETHFPFELVGRRQTDDEDSVSCEIVHKVLQRSSTDPSQMEADTKHHGLYKGNMVIPPDVNFTATYLPDDIRVIYWLIRPSDPYEGFYSPLQLVVHVTSLVEKSEHKSSTVDMCMPLWTLWSNISWGLFGFSAATGRFCIVDDEKDVKILDYGLAMPGGADAVSDTVEES